MRHEEGVRIQNSEFRIQERGGLNPILNRASHTRHSDSWRLTPSFFLGHTTLGRMQNNGKALSSNFTFEKTAEKC
jgi:hypothetical protein